MSEIYTFFLAHILTARYNVTIVITFIFMYIFIVGVLVGSFINVVALRYNTSLSFTKGRSVCFSCSMPLQWFELIPLVSFLFLRGKCRRCRSHISWQYPIVELLSGYVFLAIALRQYAYWPLYSMLSHGLLYSVLFFVFYAVVFSLLMVIGLYDIKHTIIPDKLVYTFIGLSLAKLLLYFYCIDFAFTFANMFDLAAPLILSVPFGIIWLVSDGRWIGFGDVKLMFGIGALLGFTLGLSAVVLGFWIGAIIGIACIVFQKHRKKGSRKWEMDSEIPFAPYLIAGTIIAFATHVDIFSISQLLSFIH